MKRWVDKYYHRLEITAFPVLGIVSTITNICKAGSCECIEKRRLTEQTFSQITYWQNKSLAVAKKDVSFVSPRFSTSC